MRLPLSTYVGFALPGFFMALTAIPTYITLQKFYVDGVGLAAATVGWVLLFSRLIDAVTDPLIGWVSDRLRSPLGRRKPLMLLGGAVCAVSLWPLLQPGEGVGWPYLFAWISVFYLGAALIQVPYTAWTADLTKDYGERTRLASVGQIALLVGTVLALAAPSAFEGERAQLMALALFALIALPLTLLPAVILVREEQAAPEEAAPEGAAKSGPFDALALPFALPILRRFGLAFALNALGNTLPLTLTLFYFTYVLELDPAAPLLLYFGVAIAFVPLWTYLGNRFGRHRAWRFAILATTLLQAPAAFLGPETAWMFYLIAIFVGLFLAADFTLPQALQADLADYDAAQSGRDRAATHFALWSLTVNIATAVGAGLALLFIDFGGFVSGAIAGTAGQAPQPASALVYIAIGYAGLPMVFKLPAWWLMRGYELTPAKMATLNPRGQSSTG